MTKYSSTPINAPIVTSKTWCLPSKTLELPTTGIHTYNAVSRMPESSSFSARKNAAMNALVVWPDGKACLSTAKVANISPSLWTGRCLLNRNFKAATTSKSKNNAAKRRVRFMDSPQWTIDAWNIYAIFKSQNMTWRLLRWSSELTSRAVKICKCFNSNVLGPFFFEREVWPMFVL